MPAGAMARRDRHTARRERTQQVPRGNSAYQTARNIMFRRRTQACSASRTSCCRTGTGAPFMPRRFRRTCGRSSWRRGRASSHPPPREPRQGLGAAGLPLGNLVGCRNAKVLAAPDCSTSRMPWWVRTPTTSCPAAGCRVDVRPRSRTALCLLPRPPCCRSRLRQRSIPFRLCRPGRPAQHQDPRHFRSPRHARSQAYVFASHPAHMALSGARARSSGSLAALARWFDRHLPREIRNDPPDVPHAEPACMTAKVDDSRCESWPLASARGYAPSRTRCRSRLCSSRASPPSIARVGSPGGRRDQGCRRPRASLYHTD